MQLYKFEAAVPWRIALTSDQTGETLPEEGAPWPPSGAVEADRDATFMGVPLTEILRAIQDQGYLCGADPTERRRTDRLGPCAHL
jgi:hypothetical protein